MSTIDEIRKSSPEFENYSDDQIARAVYDSTPELQKDSYTDFASSIGVKEEPGFFSDMYNLAKSGLLQTTMGMREQLGTYDQSGMQDELTSTLGKLSSGMRDSLSQELTRAKPENFFGFEFTDAATNPGVLGAKFVQQLGAQVPMMGAGTVGAGLLKGGASMYGKSLATVPGAEGAAAAASTLSKAAAPIAFGASETLATAGGTGLDVRDMMNNIPDDTLIKSEPFQNEYWSLRDQGAEHVDAFQAARHNVTEDAVFQAKQDVAPLTFLFGAGAGAVFDKIFSGASKNVAAAGIKAGITEGLQELPQSMSESYYGKKAAKEFGDQSINPEENVWGAGVEGALMGMGTGAGFGAATHGAAKMLGRGSENDLQDFREDLDAQQQEQPIDVNIKSKSDRTDQDQVNDIYNQPEQQEQSFVMPEEFTATHEDPETGDLYQYLTEDKYREANGNIWSFYDDELSPLETKQEKTDDVRSDQAEAVPSDTTDEVNTKIEPGAKEDQPGLSERSGEPSVSERSGESVEPVDDAGGYQEKTDDSSGNTKNDAGLSGTNEVSTNANADNATGTAPTAQDSNTGRASGADAASVDENANADRNDTGTASDQDKGSVTEKQPWEMSSKEWNQEKEKARPNTSQSNFTKNSKSEAVGNAKRSEFLNYGAKNETQQKLKDAQAGKIKLSKDELEDLEWNLNNRTTHKEVIQKALKEGKPVPQEVLNEYPELTNVQSGKKKQSNDADNVKGNIQQEVQNQETSVQPDLESSAVEKTDTAQTTEAQEVENVQKSDVQPVSDQKESDTKQTVQEQPAESDVSEKQADNDLPNILTQTRKQYLTEQIKKQGIKRKSPGYADAVSRLESEYEEEVSKAQASLPFEKFRKLDGQKGLSEETARDVYNQLREEYGELRTEQQPKRDDVSDLDKNTKQKQSDRPVSDANDAVVDKPERQQVTEQQKEQTKEAGEELYYNRRNRDAKLKWEDIKDENDTLKVKQVVKQKVFPRPNYEKMVENGTNPLIAYVIKNVYDSVSTKPVGFKSRSDEGMQNYITELNRVMDAVQAWTQDKKAVAYFAANLAQSARASQRVMSGNTVSMSEIMGDKPLEKQKSLLDFVYPNGYKEYADGLRSIGGNKVYRALQPGLNDFMKAVKDIQSGWPIPQPAWKKRGFKIQPANVKITAEARTSLRGGKEVPYVTIRMHQGTSDIDGAVKLSQVDYLIIEDASSIDDKSVKDAIKKLEKSFKEQPVLLLDKYDRLKGNFKTEQEAIDSLNKKGGDTEKVKPEGRLVENASRKGIEYRENNRDVSSQEILDTFGLRGINFGNWMKADTPKNVKERQLHLNHIYDSFMDLANILNVPPKAISLNGMLGVAVGAQGRGGRAAAHFVPGVNEINITRRTGAGSLVHEWGHALDHYFGVAAGLAKSKEPFVTHHEFGRLPETAEIRPEIKKAFDDIVSAMKTRNQTEAEFKKGEEQHIQRSKDRLESWFKYARKDFKENSEAFEKLIEKAWNLDVGEGYEKIGRSWDSAILPIVSEMRELHKKETGRVMPIDTVKGINSNIQSYKYAVENKKDYDSHEPQKTKSEYYKESQKEDAGSKKAYWSQPTEMFARAFDAFIMDQMASNDAVNEYLTSIPYLIPIDQEKIDVAVAFQKLIDTLKTEETEEGNVKLYSKTEGTARGSTKRAIESVVPNKAKGIVEVVQSIEDLDKLRFEGDNANYSIRSKDAPKKTVKAYKLFKVKRSQPGKLFPLYVDASNPVPVGAWLDADIGELNDNGKVKSKIGPLAFRPGWHAGVTPSSSHIGGKRTNGKPTIRDVDTVWAEVEVAADIDYQEEANSNASIVKSGPNKGKLNTKEAQITDKIPEDGYYRYKTNSNMTGDWIISGSMKVNKILTDAEVEKINNENGVKDLPREAPFDNEAYGIKYSKTPSRTEGLYDARTDKIYLIADNLTEASAKQVLMHEAYHRARRSDKFFKHQVKKIDERLQKRFDLAKHGKGTPIERDAYLRVLNSSAKDEHKLEEFQAYLVTQYNSQPKKFFGEIRKIINDLIASIRAALIRIGIVPNSITAADLNALAKYGLQERTAKPAQGGVELRSEQSDTDEQLNRMVRNQHKGISDKVKALYKREMTPGGLLPQQVFDLKITRDSEFNATEVEAGGLISGLEREIKKTWGVKNFTDLTEEKQSLLNDRLSGKNVDLPQNIADRIDMMRLYIDKLSAQYIEILQEEVAESENEQKKAMIEIITGNLGRYVNRSYKAFDDKNWSKNISSKILNDARRYLEQRFNQEEEELSKAELDKRVQNIINDILKDNTAYDSFERYITESKLGAKDMSILKRRKQIAPEIRALLGEYTDPRVTFVKSATKMSRLVHNDMFLKKVKEIGLESGFLFTEDNRPLEETEIIAAEGNESYKPLSGLYTYPEVLQGFKDALNRESMESWYRYIVQANGFVKYGKTVLSPTTMVRNFMSAAFFTMANSHFDWSHMQKSIASFKTYRGKTDQKVAYLAKLKRLGVIYDTPYAGEMMDLLSESKLLDSVSMQEGGAKLKMKEVFDTFTKFYQFGDDFWKIVGFENEVQNQMKYYELSKSEAEVKAAERIRNTYPTYSMVPRIVQKIRRFPLFGTFVSFPAEIIRTSINMVKYAKEDMEHSRELGMKRIIGLTMVSGMFFVAQEMAKQAFGVDDDEEEALRDLAPPWSKNSNILPFGRDKDGALLYLDLSFLDPYNYWKRPLNAVMRDEPVDRKLTEVAREILSPFLGEDIAFGALYDVVNNKKDTGGQIYKENDAVDDKIVKIVEHLRKSLQPGAFSNIERMAEAYTGKKSSSGQVKKLQDEMAAVVGFRVSRLNPRVALYYRSFEFSDKLKDATSIVGDIAKNPNKIDDDDLLDAKDRANQVVHDAYKDMHELVNAAKKSGLNDMTIRLMLRSRGISQEKVNTIMSGDIPDWKPSRQFLGSVIKRSDQFFDADTKDEFKRRRKLLLESK